MKKYLKLKYGLIEKNSATIRNDIILYLKKFNLWKIRDKNINSFSSGQKKKVLMIEALLYKTKLWILDEPTANLDPDFVKYEGYPDLVLYKISQIYQLQFPDQDFTYYFISFNDVKNYLKECLMRFVTVVEVDAEQALDPKGGKNAI